MLLATKDASQTAVSRGTNTSYVFADAPYGYLETPARISPPEDSRVTHDRRRAEQSALLCRSEKCLR
jgi:hypothetical protein